MPEFKSWDSYRLFERSVKREARYIFTEEVNEFLGVVKATSESRRLEVPSGKEFWRAQLGHEWVKEKFLEGTKDAFEEEVEGPYPPERMKPLRNGAQEGRVNPKGIPCLYLSTDKETAMAEVRPWIGAYVSVGLFQTVRDLTLVNLSVHSGPRHTIYLEEPDAPTRESEVWADIDRSFSEPVTRDDTSPDYAPTQVLSELFQKQGYDGVEYKSLVGDGLNVALFDLDAAELICCFLYQVKSVSFVFSESANPYFIKKTP